MAKLRFCLFQNVDPLGDKRELMVRRLKGQLNLLVRRYLFLRLQGNLLRQVRNFGIVGNVAMLFFGKIRRTFVLSAKPREKCLLKYR
jgi:hypothetical protein